MKAGNKIMVLFLVTLFCSGVLASPNASEAMQLTVDSAVSQALEGNLNLQLQKNEVEIGQGVKLMEDGAFDSYIEAGISGGEQEKTPLIVGDAEKEEMSSWNTAVKKKMKTGTEVALSWENDRYVSDSQALTINPSYSSSFGLSVSQPLLKGRGRKSQTAKVRAAEKYTEALVYMVEEQTANLAANVKKSYWELVYALHDIEVKKLSLELARNLREATSKKIDSGVLAKVEIYQPDSEIARREEALIAAERSIANAEDRLKLLMNSNDWSLSFVPVDKPVKDVSVPELNTVIANVLDNKPNIKASDLQADAARILFDKAEDNLRPSLALEGAAGMKGVGDNYDNAVDDTFSDGDFGWQIGLTVQLPIGNRVSRGALIKAKAELSRSKLRVELLRREAVQSAREAVRNITLSMKTIEATRKTSLAAKKRLEAEQVKFEVGLSTANDVLQFQDSYAQALISEKRATVDLAQAQAELDRIQGVVSFRNGKVG